MTVNHPYQTRKNDKIDKVCYFAHTKASGTLSWMLLFTLMWIGINLTWGFPKNTSELALNCLILLVFIRHSYSFKQWIKLLDICQN